MKCICKFNCFEIFCESLSNITECRVFAIEQCWKNNNPFGSVRVMTQEDEKKFFPFEVWYAAFSWPSGNFDTKMTAMSQLLMFFSTIYTDKDNFVAFNVQSVHKERSIYTIYRNKILLITFVLFIIHENHVEVVVYFTVLFNWFHVGITVCCRIWVEHEFRYRRRV